MKQKALAILLALCMVASMLPATVFAAHDGEELTRLTVPETVGTLTASAVEPNAASYSVSLTGSANGLVELLVDSPAEAGSEVYFVADPDDGYLADIYFDGLEAEDFVYIGADIWGFIMPSNKVTLEVQFIEAEGEEHDISVYDPGGGGRWALSRDSAKEYESVLLAVESDLDYDFEPTELVWAFGADIYYLFEQDGVHYYEIFMGSEDVDILLCYSAKGTHKITVNKISIFNGDVTTNVDSAVTGKEVFVYATPDPGYVTEDVRVTSGGGKIELDLTYVGEEQGSSVYSFIMPPCAVKVDADFRADTMDVTVRYGSGGVAYADVAQAKMGDTVTVTCQPEDNYRVFSVTGADGIVDNGDNTYTFTMPAQDVVIDVAFKTIYNPITVTVDTGLGGNAFADVAEAKAGDTVTLTCMSEEGYRVAQITGVKELNDNGDGTWCFIMPDDPVELHVLFLRNENPFLDVNETHFFYDPVLWAVEKGITNGIDDTHFGPFLATNRAAVVTMLWRYAGSPEPLSDMNPFTDVPEGSFYYDAVLWAVENGITNGVSPDQFGPTLECNRAQVVTFLWRFLGQPMAETAEHPFTDVEAGSFYEQAVLWALENGITTGATATTFNPNGQCQRAQFVTFLYRTAQLPQPEVPEEPIDPEVPAEPEEPSEP